MNNKENIKQELFKSIRYIVPIICVFLGILILNNYSTISTSIINNIDTLKNILAPLFIGFIIAYILNKPMVFLENKLKLKRGLSISIIYISLILLIIGTGIYLVPNIKSSIQEITAYIPQGIVQIENIFNNIVSHLNLDVSNIDLKLQINDFVSKVLIPFSTTTATVVGDLLMNTMSVIVTYAINIILGIVISIYLLLSKESCIENMNILSKKILGKFYNNIQSFINILDNNIGVYIVAKSMDSMIYGIICTIVLSLVNSKYALLLGIIAGITNMIPLFGPVIGTIVAVVINLFFSCKVAVVTLIEGAVLDPYFVGKKVGVPPVITILAVTFATKYTGFIGILLSVPIASVLLHYIKIIIDEEKNKATN